SNQGIPAVAPDLLGDANTDWQDEIYRNAISTDHNISVAGAIKEFPYRVSIGYTNQNGVLEDTQLERTTLGLAFNPSLFQDHLKINVNVKGMNIDNNFSNTGAIRNAMLFDPTKPVRSGNQEFGGYYTWTSSDGTPNFI